MNRVLLNEQIRANLLYLHFRKSALLNHIILGSSKPLLDHLQSQEHALSSEKTSLVELIQEGQATYFAPIIFQAPSRLPFNAGFSIRCSMTDSFHFLLSPRSVSAYSWAMISSSTPQRDKIRAQMTPVRSFPAVQ